MGWLHKHKPVEAITDPASGELSASRFLLCVIVLIYWPANCLMDFALRLFHAGKMENWAVLGVITGAVAGVYWFNSTAGAWQRYSSLTIGSSPQTPIKVGTVKED